MDAIYLVASLAAMAVLIGLCAALFGVRQTPFTSPEALQALLARSLPGFRAADWTFAADRTSALIQCAGDGAIYLAVVRGDGVVTRKLTGALRSISRDGGNLRLALRDVTLPRARLALADADCARIWEARLARGAR